MMVRRLIGGIEHGVQPARIVFHPARDLLVALVEIARLRRLVRYQIGEGDAVGLTQRFFVIRRQRLVAFGVGLDDGIVTVIVAYACEDAAVAYFDAAVDDRRAGRERLDVGRSEDNTSELQSLMRRSYAVFCLKKKRYEL